MNRNYEDKISDAEIWERVVRNVKPLHERKKSARLNNALRPQSRTKDPIKKGHTIQPIQKNIVAKTRKTPGPNRGIDRATYTKLRKGRMTIEATLDLHGMREEEAYQTFRRFLVTKKHIGCRCVIVITGKGKSHLSKGKLRRALPLWIESSHFSDLVLAFSPAAPKDGGEGAWYILLRKNKSPRL